MQAGPGSAKGKQNIPGAPPPKKHSPRLGIAARLVQAAAILHLGGTGGVQGGLLSGHATAPGSDLS